MEREAKLQALRDTLNASIEPGGWVTDEDLDASLAKTAEELAAQGYKVWSVIYFAAAEAESERHFALYLDRRFRIAIGQAFIAKLRHRCSCLASLPGTLGTSRSDLKPELRSVVFRYSPEAIEIVNVLPGHRDIETHFGDPDPSQAH